MTRCKMPDAWKWLAVLCGIAGIIVSAVLMAGQGQKPPLDWSRAVIIGDSMITGMRACTEELSLLGCAINASSGREVGPDTVGLDTEVPVIRTVSGYETILIVIGTNNWKYSSEQTAEMYREMLDVIEENNPGAQIYVSNVPPTEPEKEYPHITAERIASINAAIRQVVDQRRKAPSAHGCAYTWIDSFQDYFHGTARGKTSDGIHPLPEISRDWWRWLKSILDPASSRR